MLIPHRPVWVFEPISAFREKEIKDIIRTRMSQEHKFQERIGYSGDLSVLAVKVCQDFEIGEYKSHKTITVGYEDLNIILETSQDRFLVKALANFRDQADRERYLQIMQAVNEAGVSHPKLFKSEQGYLHKMDIDEAEIFMFVMQFVDGKTFYDLRKKPTEKEIRFLAKQAALINKIDLRPAYVYDSWAIPNFLKEYEEIRGKLKKSDQNLIDPVAKEFEALDLDKLPKAFVHGDIIDTNTIRDKEGKLWILDFSVSNYYPRIQEITILACDLLLDFSHPEKYKRNLQVALEEYQKEVQLTDKELEVLPLYIKVSHAMHILGSSKSIIKDGDSKESQDWLEKGRKGLRFTSKPSQE